MTEPLVRTIALACPVTHAFEVFTQKVDLWWPRGHRKTQDATLHFTDDALIERGADGSAWIMGRITAIDPPRLLQLDWFPGSPAAPTAVEIRFAKTESGTQITITHRPLPDSAPIWPQRVAQFTKGWDAVLPALRTFIEED